MPRKISVSPPCMGLIIAAIIVFVFAVYGCVGYALSNSLTKKAPQTTVVEDDRDQTSVSTTGEHWTSLLYIVGIAALCLLIITLFLYCLFKRTSNKRHKRFCVNEMYQKQTCLEESITDIESSACSQRQTLPVEQQVGHFWDIVLGFLAYIIPTEHRFGFFQNLYSYQTLAAGINVKKIFKEVERSKSKAKIHERNLHHLKKWTTLLGTKPQLSKIKDTLIAMKLDKVLEQFESFLSDIPKEVMSKEKMDQNWPTGHSNNPQILETFQISKCQKTKRYSIDSLNVNLTERSRDQFNVLNENLDKTTTLNHDTLDKRSIATPLNTSESIQQFNSDTDNASDRPNPNQDPQESSSESFLSVKSGTPTVITEQLNQCSYVMNKKDQREWDHLQTVSLNEKSTSSSSSEYGNEIEYNRMHTGRFHKDHFVTRKSFIGRAHVKSATCPKICQQLLPKTHSSTLYLMKKLMKRGEEMIEKDYTYFMFHSVKQIMACTKECEDRILAITCEDFESCHKIVSKCGERSYIIDSADGFLPPLGFDEWECLELFKQQRDMVCQRKKDENDEFVGSVYMFISYDGRPVRKENDNDHCQNDEGQNDESSLETTENSGQTPKQTQQSVLTDNKCTEYKKGISTQNKAEDNESVSDEDVESLLLNHPDTVRLPETSELAESLLSVLTDNTSQVIV